MSVSNSLGYQGFPIPVGSVLPYAGQITPSGWLICDGTLYSPNEYPALFSVIGNKYGSTFSGAVQQTGDTLVCVNFQGTVTQLGTTLTIVSATTGQVIVPDMEIAITGFGTVTIISQIDPNDFLVDISQTVAVATPAVSTFPDTAQGGFAVGQEIILSGGFLPVVVISVSSGIATVTPSQDTNEVVFAQSNDFALPDLVGRYIEGASAVSPTIQPATFDAGGSFTLATANIPQFNPTLTSSTTSASLGLLGSNGADTKLNLPGVEGNPRLVTPDSTGSSSFTVAFNGAFPLPSSTYASGRVPPAVSAPLTADGFTLNSLELVYIMKATWN
jgi:microcystin-dependent protein